MPVRGLEPHGELRLPVRQAGIELLAHGDAAGEDGFRPDAVFFEFRAQRRVGDDAGVQLHPVAGGACGVVRGDEHGSDRQRLLPLDEREHQRGEQMHAHHRVISALHDGRAQPLAPAPQDAAGRRRLVKRRRVLLRVLIALVVELREIAVEAHMPVAHKAARALRHVQERVVGLIGVAAALQLRADGPGAGIVPAAGIAAEDQDFHASLLLFAHIRSYSRTRRGRL